MTPAGKPDVRLHMLVCIPAVSSKPLVKERNGDKTSYSDDDYVLTCQRSVSTVGCSLLGTWGAQACFLDGPGLKGFLLANKEDLLMPSFPDYGYVLGIGLCRWPKPFQPFPAAFGI